MSGVGWRMNELTVLPPGVVNGWAVRPAAGATVGSIRPSGSLRLAILPPLHSASAAAAGGLAQLVGVLPDVDVLLAQRDVVQVGGVAVLAAEGRVAVALAVSAPTTPSAVLSFSARIASIFWFDETA